MCLGAVYVQQGQTRQAAAMLLEQGSRDAIEVRQFIFIKTLAIAEFSLDDTLL